MRGYILRSPTQNTDTVIKITNYPVHIFQQQR